jgi:FixJ family two-component response regulator
MPAVVTTGYPRPFGIHCRRRAPLSPRRATPTSAPQPNPDGPLLPEGASIFLVDDDDAVRDALEMSLRAAGHPVAAFGSTRQFLDAYRSGSSGCLVLDMDLPDGGAVGLLRTLAVAQVAMPAIITSRRLRRIQAADALPSGCILFLDKPFGIDELLRLIRTALGTGCDNPPAP